MVRVQYIANLMILVPYFKGWELNLCDGSTPLSAHNLNLIWMNIANLMILVPYFKGWELNSCDGLALLSAHILFES